MLKQLLILVLYLCTQIDGQLLAQRKQSPIAQCDVVELIPSVRQEVERQAIISFRAKQATHNAFNTITYVPIRPHILRRSDGTGGATIATINQVIAITNRYYLYNGYGIQFYFAGSTPDYVDNTDQYNSFTDERIVTLGHDDFTALNQYYVNKFASGAGGFAYYPANNIQSTRSFVLNEPSNIDDMGYRLVPHELGHTFNLIHTFGNSDGTTLTNELVTRGQGANCTATGDLLCDTPADPNNTSGARVIYDGNGCPQYDPASTARDANNEPYSPSITNLMSYYFACTHDFTPGQYDRMQIALALRQGHTAYSLTYPPANAAAPTNLAATLLNGVVTLTWQDNATNEMGYFIERSTSPTSGFLPIGGVAANITTFSDTKTGNVVTYYYRIKPSNNTTTGFSTIVSIKTPTCRPSFSSGCSSGDGLAKFRFNNITLSQNSGCNSGSYTSFTTVTGVLPGQTYPFSGTLLSASYKEGVTIWADFNQNGKFDSNEEKVYQILIAAQSNQFAGTLTLPASLTSGTIPLRIVVNYNTIPADPCGAYNWGETEDYLLKIDSPPVADLSLVLNTNTRIAFDNQPVSYSLTIRNDGPDNATGIQWENQLPPGMTFLSGSPNVTASANVLRSANSISLAAGQGITMTYQVQVTQPGTYRNSVQILSSDQPDPDSQPGSGTGDGQDDTATLDFRTAALSDTLYTSPNPNQTPLPAVMSNLPEPDSTQADLSLVMAADRRIVSVNQRVSFTISVRNRGGVEARNVVVRDTLFDLMPLVSFADVSIVGSGPNYTIIEAAIDTVAANSKVDIVFRAIVKAEGYIRNAAQIWSVDTPDPDSRPGAADPSANNLNGEDDVTWIDLRVIP
ncbi:DUF11 domain-containing protein [Spirosoma sp. BT702]|uniref:DUF11 domain-containing protein n=1 Tax=Spirosoma profusum TaxID=2771354 RepID=A0A926Y3F6_9BACT|nr:GEVED domain-containing protein [Spirosoma profusum]MBD2704027.1 DUF11 domain-containing protein [Spirosoma profusum]